MIRIALIGALCASVTASEAFSKGKGGRKSRDGAPAASQSRSSGVHIRGIGWVAPGAIIVLDGRECRVWQDRQGVWWCTDL